MSKSSAWPPSHARTASGRRSHVIDTSSSGTHNATQCNTMQHTATHCNTLQHTATHCTTLHHTVSHCNTATHCNTLQHTAPHCTILTQTNIKRATQSCSVLQCVAVCCSVLQCVAVCCRASYSRATQSPYRHLQRRLDFLHISSLLNLLRGISWRSTRPPSPTDCARHLRTIARAGRSEQTCSRRHGRTNVSQ